MFHQYLNDNFICDLFCPDHTNQSTGTFPSTRPTVQLFTSSLFIFSGVPGTITSLFWEAVRAAALFEVSKQLLMEFCCLVVSAGLLLLFLLLLHFINILLFWRGDREKNDFIAWTTRQTNREKVSSQATTPARWHQRSVSSRQAAGSNRHPALAVQDKNLNIIIWSQTSTTEDNIHFISRLIPSNQKLQPPGEEELFIGRQPGTTSQPHA